MDGNGRWAKARGMNRSMGHQQGVVAVREIPYALHLFDRKLEPAGRRSSRIDVAYPDLARRGVVYEEQR